MKPNDEALTEALAVFKNMLDPDDMRRALTAAYAAQFKSEEYAGLVKELRAFDEELLNAQPHSCEQTAKHAADALEALLAEREAWKGRQEATAAILKQVETERDALKAELAAANKRAANRLAVEAERDALAARLAICERMMDKEYRDAFTVADNSNTVAAQIVSMRHSRKWTQKELAEKCGMHQPQISALEDPDFENFEVATLQRVASAFDVALLVRFVPFSELAHLAPVEDEALLVIAGKALCPEIFPDAFNAYGGLWVTDKQDRVLGLARAAIAAIRPHIEAAERERIADTVKNWGDEPHFQLLAAAIRSGK